MEMEISLLVSIISIVLTLVNLIFLIMKYKQYQVNSEKIFVKRRLFRELYQELKNLMERMEFLQVNNYGSFFKYYFQIKDNLELTYLTQAQVESTNIRILGMASELFSLCGCKATRTIKHLLDHPGYLSTHKSIGSNYISIPYDMLPRNTEDLKAEILNDIIVDARVNGIRKKYLV